MTDLLEQLLDDEEGPSSATVYNDNLGFATIARGVCIDKRVPGCGLSQRAIAVANEDETATAAALATRFPRFTEHNPVRQAVLASMCFQMGSKPLRWPHFMAALEALDYAAAEAAGLDSDWARTETPARAKREMGMLRTGVWVPKVP